MLADEKMEESLGFTINIPSAYRISKAKDDFFWVRKNISNSKTMEFMFYEVPIESISKVNTSTSFPKCLDPTNPISLVYSILFGLPYSNNCVLLQTQNTLVTVTKSSVRLYSTSYNSVNSSKLQ